MINSDCKSQSYAHLMVFNKMAAKPRWPPKMQWKNNSSLDLNIPHLVWKFYGSRCFSFWGTVEQLKKWTKNYNNNSQKELDQNQESSPLLRWSLINLYLSVCQAVLAKKALLAHVLTRESPVIQSEVWFLPGIKGWYRLHILWTLKEVTGYITNHTPLLANSVSISTQSLREGNKPQMIEKPYFFFNIWPNFYLSPHFQIGKEPQTLENHFSFFSFLSLSSFANLYLQQSTAKRETTTKSFGLTFNYLNLLGFSIEWFRRYLGFHLTSDVINHVWVNTVEFHFINSDNDIQNKSLVLID